MRLTGGKVRRRPDGPGDHLQLLPSKAVGISEGLRPSSPQTVPRTVCPYGNRLELHGGKVRRGPGGSGEYLATVICQGYRHQRRTPPVHASRLRRFERKCLILIGYL